MQTTAEVELTIGDWGREQCPWASNEAGTSLACSENRPAFVRPKETGTQLRFVQ